MQIDVSTIIIGAGPGGLACGACLKKIGEEFRILDRAAQVADSWRHHYDRLHLHTHKKLSNLPYLPFQSELPGYPSRDQVVGYLERYVGHHDLKIDLNSEVERITAEDHSVLVTTNHGSIRARNVVIATGNTKDPHRVSKSGMESFSGEVIHSAEYVNGKPYRDKNVLVIGFGNSACEIAMCLEEHGAKPAMSVRSPVNIVPRDIFGIPALGIGIVTDFLPPKLVDWLTAPVIRSKIGDLKRYGLEELPYGPKVQIVRYGQIPVLDIGIVELLKQGKVRIYGDILEVNGAEVIFEKNKRSSFDAIIMATGYDHGLERIIDLSRERLKDIRRPIAERKLLGQDRIYFCGFYVSPNGMLREVGIEAGHIAQDISKLTYNGRS